MKNATLEQIKNQILQAMLLKYGYCGCADSGNQAVLNSGGNDEDFIITIKDAGAIEAEKGANQDE